ncbi:IDEAL domain-containing protein [Paenibacillus humicola]|uniref:IDEAL domain-containing protein n=1 Tax=Paenibacillus humicola TaxID=3110540 RepID=UPI00237B2615|nr:IDEAL domain-containing protein [Paenibacillus humicola]
MKFQIGDWVKGNTHQGELVHGYIGTLNTAKHTVGVHVVASDHEAAIGQLVEIQDQSVSKLADAPLDQEEQFNSLIDLALATRDEPWFNELTAQLISLRGQQAKRSANANRQRSTSINNRLGRLGHGTV